MKSKMKKKLRTDPWQKQHFPLSMNTNIVVENFHLNFGINYDEFAKNMDNKNDDEQEYYV